MSDKIGPVDLRDSEDHPFLGREIALPRRFSETTAHGVDQAVGELLREAEARDAALVGAHRASLDRLIAALEREETLNADQIEACLGPRDRLVTPAGGRTAWGKKS
jgi:cell division protease FtsH